MNAVILCAFALLSLTGTFLLLRKLFGVYPWDICRSFSDVLVLPWVAAYLLLLLAAGLGAWGAEWCAPRQVRDVSKRHASTRSPHTLTPRANPSSS